MVCPFSGASYLGVGRDITPELAFFAPNRLRWVRYHARFGTFRARSSKQIVVSAVEGSVVWTLGIILGILRRIPAGAMEVAMSVRHALLALLAEKPRYGLRLRQEFEARTGEVWPLNVGQVYTTLQRLERDGLVESDDEADGPQKGYSITPDGSRGSRWIPPISRVTIRTAARCRLPWSPGAPTNRPSPSPCSGAPSCRNRSWRRTGSTSSSAS